MRERIPSFFGDTSGDTGKVVRMEKQLRAETLCIWNPSEKDVNICELWWYRNAPEKYISKLFRVHFLCGALTRIPQLSLSLAQVVDKLDLICILYEWTSGYLWSDSGWLDELGTSANSLLKSVGRDYFLDANQLEKTLHENSVSWAEIISWRVTFFSPRLVHKFVGVHVDRFQHDESPNGTWSPRAK